MAIFRQTIFVTNCIYYTRILKKREIQRSHPYVFPLAGSGLQLLVWFKPAPGDEGRGTFLTLLSNNRRGRCRFVPQRNYQFPESEL